MKLSPILAQFLYSKKHLQLAGIGKFLLDPKAHVEQESSKGLRLSTPLDIKFEYSPSSEQDTALIAYISEETGKMKSLAAADLDSHLELARQFLNIGKPFTFEGIGTLIKNKIGRIEFTAGPQLNEKVKDLNESDPTSSTEESFTKFGDIFSVKKNLAISPRRMTGSLVVLGGLIMAIWGGYSVYKKGASINKNKETQEKSISMPAVDSTVLLAGTQTTASSTQSYRFIIERSGRQRAFKRFRDLRSYGVKVNLETRDSLTYKLFLVLESEPADTTRIKDSLSALYVNPYYMKSGKAVIE